MIAPASTVACLERKGVLRCDGRRTPRDFRPAYRWMAERMCERIGPPPPGVTYPLWAWARWSADRLRPDMRVLRHHSGVERCARLEIDMPGERILLSDFDAWHCVLNGWCLTDTEAEDTAFNAALEAAGIPWGWPYPEPFRAQVMGSWLRIFDLDRPADPAWAGPPAERVVQATFWCLERSWVRRIEWFDGLPQARRKRGSPAPTALGFPV